MADGANDTAKWYEWVIWDAETIDLGDRIRLTG